MPGAGGPAGAVTWGGRAGGGPRGPRPCALVRPRRRERAEPRGARRGAGAPGSPCPPTSPWCPWRRGRTAARRRRRSRTRRQARPRAASPTARAWVSAAAPARGTKAEARLRGAAGGWGRPGPEGRAAREEGRPRGGEADGAPGRAVGLLPPRSRARRLLSLLASAHHSACPCGSPLAAPSAARRGALPELRGAGRRAEASGAVGPHVLRPHVPPPRRPGPGRRMHLSPIRGGFMRRCETP